MFLKKLDDFRHSLLFRMAFSYAAVFCVSSFLTLAVCYYKISALRLENTDLELIGEFMEYQAILKQSGFDRILAELALENEEENVSNVFFRIFSPDGELIASSDMQSWGMVDISKAALEQLSSSTPYVLQMLELPHYPYKIRTIYGRLSPEKIFQFGFSLEENEKYLMIFQNMFLIIMAVIIFLSGFIGWMISKNAVKGIREVVTTANDIAKGSYEKRVSVKKKTREIEELETAFNEMLDKIRLLLNDMKEMIDNIAHDLRSPLTRIRGIAEMNLINGRSIEDYREMAGSTVEECDNLIDLVNTMLDITEIEAGISEINTEEIDMNQVILQITDFFSPVAEENDVRILTDLPEKCRVLGDRQKYQRVIMNLLENAIKFTPPKGEVRIFLLDHPNYLRMVFKDTGSGISPEDMPKIFNRFYRGDRSRNQAGIGLGLSLVRAIVKSLNGSISVESALDKGSVFTVTIPK